MIPRLTSFCIFIYFVVSFSNVGHARLAPDYIRPCNDTSTECLTKATQFAIEKFATGKGLSHLGVKSLDPFDIDEVALNLPGINATFHEGKATGFRTCIADEVTSDLHARTFGLAMHCNLTIEGRYSAVGRLLLFHINGGGESVIKLTNLGINMTINTKYVKDEKGQKYFSIRNYKYKINYGDHVSIDLKNLFKESKALSDTINEFINQNSKLLAQEMGDPIVAYAVKLVAGAVATFFLKVPCHELINVPIPDI